MTNEQITAWTIVLYMVTRTIVVGLHRNVKSMKSNKNHIQNGTIGKKVLGHLIQISEKRDKIEWNGLKS